MVCYVTASPIRIFRQCGAAVENIYIRKERVVLFCFHKLHIVYYSVNRNIKLDVCHAVMEQVCWAECMNAVMKSGKC